MDCETRLKAAAPVAAQRADTPAAATSRGVKESVTSEPARRCTHAASKDAPLRRQGAYLDFLDSSPRVRPRVGLESFLEFSSGRYTRLRAASRDQAGRVSGDG